MNRLFLIVLAALAAVLVLAARLGGAQGGGVLLGGIAGTALAALSTLWVRHVARTRPERALAALTMGFLVKLACLVLGGLALRFVAAAGERADHRSFLIAFAAAVALVMPLGIWVALVERKRGAGAAPAVEAR